MPQTSGLTIRQHAREALALRVEFVIGETYREQVRFSPMSPAPQPHITRGIAIDVSPGGMGLVCEQFVPRMCEGTVRVYDPMPASSAADGSPVYEVVFEHTVKVRRVTLETHDPTYALGLAFVDAGATIDDRVNELLDMAEKARAAQEGGSGG